MKPQYDVVILGSGPGGSILGAILARNGATVALIDKGSHPRFAIGESTIPQTTMMLKVLAERYGVPELHHISSLESVQRKVSDTCGLKLAVGFVYHRNGEDVNPCEANQTVTGRDEVHYFRQDIDFYLLKVAARYGCTVHQNTVTEKVDIGRNDVRVATTRGEITARFIVDGSGYGSVLAEMFGLRNTGGDVGRTHSRGVFTHMVDVPPFEDIMPRSDCRAPVPWSRCTLHHVFDRGWMWVIPFDNHEQSCNPLCSVGLMLDPRYHPKDDALAPEEEFRDFVDQYPGMRAQFRNATAKRQWVSSDRINYSSRACVGDRFALLSHSSGFIDPLFSRGLCSTVETVNVLAQALLYALKPGDERHGDFTAERFLHVDALQKDLIAYNDRLVASAFTAFKDYDLWNAYYRVWALTSIYGFFRVARAYCRYVETGEETFLRSLETCRHPGCITSNDGLWNAFSKASELVEGTEIDDRGEVRYTARKAAAGIFALLREVNAYPEPLQDLGDPGDRFSRSDAYLPYRLSRWMRSGVPADLKEEYFDFDPATLFRLARMDSPAGIA